MGVSGIDGPKGFPGRRGPPGLQGILKIINIFVRSKN